MPFVRTRLAIGCTALLVAVAGLGPYDFRSGRTAAAGLEVVARVGTSPGAGNWYLVNPVYPPQTVGKYESSSKTMVSITVANQGPHAAASDPVFVVNPTFPSQVVGTFAPLGKGRSINMLPPEPVPRTTDPPSIGVRVRKHVEGK